ncbi:uncharacterized protein [Argopecten irradians]|uniref:uncharacterized protein n=1 Tax=Argopecten irradians TaxID=31199 RepID=UPI003723FE73
MDATGLVFFRLFWIIVLCIPSLRSEDCVEGMYGYHCNMTCPDGCDKCGQYDGVCEGSNDVKTILPASLFGLLASVGLPAIMIKIICRWRRRRREAAKERQSVSDQSPNLEVVPHERHNYDANKISVAKGNDMDQRQYVTNFINNGNIYIGNRGIHTNQIDSKEIQDSG